MAIYAEYSQTSTVEKKQIPKKNTKIHQNIILNFFRHIVLPSFSYLNKESEHKITRLRIMSVSMAVYHTPGENF